MYRLYCVLIVVLISCSEQKINEIEATYKAKKDSLENVYKSKESLLLELTEVLSEVQSGVSQVSQRAGNLQKINKAKASDKTKIRTMKDQILSELSFIENEISRNKKSLSQLHAKLDNSGSEVSQLKSIVKNLEETIKNKEEEIMFLKDELVKKESELEEAFVTINKNYEKIQKLNTQLETVYYVVNTEDELEGSGVVERSGGFLGINSKLTLTNDFSLDLFTKKNMNLFDQLVVNSGPDDLEILSNHPRTSYKVEKDGENTKLVIIDKPSFWSASKFLTIVVD